jgi:hypothetical protein
MSTDLHGKFQKLNELKAQVRNMQKTIDAEEKSLRELSLLYEQDFYYKLREVIFRPPNKKCISTEVIVVGAERGYGKTKAFNRLFSELSESAIGEDVVFLTTQNIPIINRRFAENLCDKFIRGYTRNSLTFVIDQPISDSLRDLVLSNNFMEELHGRAAPYYRNKLGYTRVILISDK